MPGWVKVFLVIAVVVVFLVIGVVGVGVFWWMRNQDALLSRAKEVATDGKEFGRQTDNQGCVDESVSRYRKEPGFGNAISTSIFMRTCLDASRPTSGFCNGVPKKTEFMKSAEWRREQCERVQMQRDSYCQQLFNPVQEYCEKRSASAE